ncbi:hypothetical protein PanWU01x14_148580 [Parasponia andersonii]|uniref:Uncharacterized protein n=1 Tax=Parasponia andersonii TaxID=3476 RepID=A0A2P5CJ42_PARAD|nr:hypothetical protein PanWU01x14_148580 [Parasponia andersonii]
MVNRSNRDGIKVAAKSSSTSLFTRDVLQDLGLSEGEQPKVMITQVKHRVTLGLDPSEPKTSQDTPDGASGTNEEGEDGLEASSCKDDNAFLVDANTSSGQMI